MIFSIREDEKEIRKRIQQVKENYQHLMQEPEHAFIRIATFRGKNAIEFYLGRGLSYWSINFEEGNLIIKRCITFVDLFLWGTLFAIDLIMMYILIKTKSPWRGYLLVLLFMLFEFLPIWYFNAVYAVKRIKKFMNRFIL